MNSAVWRAMVIGPWLVAPGRSLFAVAAIAIGVALGLAVHLINAGAATEFERAARQLAGDADLVIRGGRAGFDEQLYPAVARLPGVAAVSPVLELDASLPDRRESLRIIAFDALRAHAIQPQFAGSSARGSVLLDPDAIRLTASAARVHGLSVGDRLRLAAGTRTVELQVAEILPEGLYRQGLGIMDIAAAQWHFDRSGTLSRIDIRLSTDTTVAASLEALKPLLPPGVHAVTPQSDSERSLALTRAYRLNLDMLALIALFTGSFMVFSSQVLATLRRRRHLAVLRALGVTRGAVLAALTIEGALIGVAGSIIGLVAGRLLAAQLLVIAGGDLGAGYFRHLDAQLAVDLPTLAAFAMLGTAFATAGAALPAWQAARRAPARELHARDDDDRQQRRAWAVIGLPALAGAAVLSQLPAAGGMPVAGYAAVALMLCGTVALMPALSGPLLSLLPSPSSLAPALGLASLRFAPRHVAISVSAILVSFSLVAAMMIMVLSFRQSLDDWLVRVLPADIYLRAASAGETATFTGEEQRRIAAVPGVGSVAFSRFQSLLIDPARPALTVIARDLPQDAQRTLPLVAAPAAIPADGPPPAWVSEIAASLFGWSAGQSITLPLGGKAARFTVAGIWRDYARQNGAVIIDRGLYAALTADTTANDAAIHLAPGATRPDIGQSIRHALGPESSIEITSAGDIRRLSLDIFDRTFAITWVLELAALIVGLFGVSVAFGVQALSRRREFGMLRHLGMSRRQVAAMLAGEGALTAGVGTVFGLVLGTAIGIMLIEVINRQSFHWSMELHMPWLELGLLGVAITACAMVTAVVSARSVMQTDVIAAVREDW
jgi:putative ABC transport system permease protein